MNRVGQDVREVRSQICNVFLVVLGIAAVPALAASLYRITVTGWLPIMAVQFGLFTALFLVILFRKHVPYNLRAGFIVAGFLTLGIGGSWQLGLLGSAVVFVVVTPAISTIFFGTRVGVAILVVNILSLGMIGVYTVREHRLPVFDPSFYVTQPSAWFSTLFGSALVAGTLLAALVIYNRGLAAALEKANQTEDELTRRIEERTSELTREIDERQAVELGLREAESALIEVNNSLEARIEARTREQQAEKERFRSLVENSPNAISLKDVKGHYLLANERFETLMGVRRGNVIGKTVEEIFEGTFAESGIERDREVIERKQAIEIDEVFDRGDRTLNLLTTKFPIFGGDGAVAAVGTVHTDLTERKRAEEALRESEARFRTLVEYAPEAITIIDVDTGLYVDVNPMAETLHARPRDELVGKIGPADLSPEIQPDGRPSSEAAPEYLSRALAGEFPRFEWMHLTQDGQETLCEVSLARLPDPHRNLVRASIFDITERKAAEEALRKSEAQFRHAEKIAHLCHWLADSTFGNWTYASRNTEALFGWPYDELLGPFSKFLAVIHPDDRDLVANAYSEVAVNPKRYELNYRTIRADGEIRHFYEVGEPETNDTGDVTQFRGTTQDITEQKRAEEQLRQAQKMDAVGQLTGGVAHDFNNLLAIILGNLELVEDNVVCDDDCRNHIEMAIKATERGAGLTQRLLAFSRKQALRPVPVDAKNLIQGMQDLLRRSLGETIEIEIVAEAGLWTTEIDPGQLEGALLNLAINARDAMPDGGKLTIEASNARLADEYAAAQSDVEPGQYVLISIGDTGTGMTPEVREQVFDPFFTTKETGKGTGLGLSMVHGFVKQSGGHIVIDSEIGEGTTFKLYLPRYNGKKAAVERHKQAAESVSGTGEVILVVEDDADLRTMIIDMLQSLGYGVLKSGTATSALETLEKNSQVNLLLTDMVLPGGMSGRALADWAREKDSNLPVLYMSGYTENAIIHHGRLDEGVQLLEKPFRKADLARAVRKALDSEPA
jgi:PAS domain S-box-containing protein